MLRIIYTIALCFWVLSSYAWNALGHKVVAQIAFDNLSPNAKVMCHKYLRSRFHNSPNSSFVASATWMDQIRRKQVYWYDGMHYIDIPFSNDQSNLPSIESTNAVWAIKNATVVFTSKKTNFFDKQLALRMLIHIIGDIHQPLHSITKVSAQLPKGDLGGNLFLLGKNSVGINLHQYWDNGAGFFLGRNDEKHVKDMAQELEQKWPCALITTETKPEKWAEMSYQLAVKKVYQLNFKDIPSKKYQANSQILVQKQAVYAGCRLAALLNKIAKSRS
ncbi:MAG: S1/P1 nuclease [Legionella longbeachae]|nr:S1/P1 nuclease [Legionella longbeachae]